MSHMRSRRHYSRSSVRRGLSHWAKCKLISFLSKAYQSPTAIVTGSGRAGTFDDLVVLCAHYMKWPMIRLPLHSDFVQALLYLLDDAQIR